MHGEDVCLRCLAPESATPSARVYRGSLLALAVGTLVAIFLLLRPPQDDAGDDTVRTIPTVAPAASATATPTRAGSTARTATPGGDATQAAATTTTPAATATATTTEVAAASRMHTVQEGESLSSIAAANGTTVEQLQALNPGVSPESLQPGQQLILPPAP